MHSLAIKTPSGQLEYTITHRARVTKRLHLELDDKGGLVVVAPRHWSKTYISKTLAQNTTRIARFLNTARRQQTKPLQYTNGERHLYLGENYQLVIRPGGRNKAANIDANEIHVRVRCATAESVKSVLHLWYRQQAQEIFNERMKIFVQECTWLAGKTMPLKLRRMKRTWGNCSSKGVIKLNTHLIKAPMTLIDSVIAHELCHLEEMNHSKTFYALLESLNPGWRQDRAALRSNGFLYLQE